jgi:hypothetical protein
MQLSINPAPSELIDLIRLDKKPVQTLPYRDKHITVQEAEEMLSYLDPDMSYQDWVNVGMALHSRGFNLSLWDTWSSKGTKYKSGECAKKWQSFNEGAGISIGTLIKMAQDAGWVKRQYRAEASNTKKKEPSLQIIHWSKMNELPKRCYLIKDLLDEEAFSVVYGASNSGKTFFALDIACHVALGWMWQNKKIRKGCVVYIAGEGGLGISERLEAFRKHHKLENYGDIYIIPQALILIGENDYTENFIELVKDIPSVKLIIIDTLARSMNDGDENYAGDIGRFVRNCDIIRSKTKAHIMVIHHTGKDEKKGARGSSALKAAIDTEIQISQSAGIIKGEVKKQRDGKTGYVVYFTLHEHKVGKDEEGNPIYSCALSEANLEEKKLHLKGQARQTYQILCNLMIDKGIERIPKAGIKNQKTVRLDEFKDHFFKAGISDTDKPDSISKAFSRQIRYLKDKGYIAKRDGYVWITDRPDK